jgi:hypothetical protein
LKAQIGLQPDHDATSFDDIRLKTGEAATSALRYIPLDLFSLSTVATCALANKQPSISDVVGVHCGRTCGVSGLHSRGVFAGGFANRCTSSSSAITPKPAEQKSIEWFWNSIGSIFR